MKLPLLEDLPDVAGRNVLVRCDFNVPLADGRITDDSRIRAALPTLTWLSERGAHVTACTHLGRPKGQPDPRYDVASVAAKLLTRGRILLPSDLGLPPRSILTRLRL